MIVKKDSDPYGEFCVWVQVVNYYIAKCQLVIANC